MLVNALSGAGELDLSKEKITEALVETGISEQIRGKGCRWMNLPDWRIFFYRPFGIEVCCHICTIFSRYFFDL